MRGTIIVLSILLAASVARGQFVVKAATDEAFPVVLVDATDGYTPETEKKFGDTTITYCNITDGNTPSSYTDDADLWKEIGDGTGEYEMVIGAGEFTGMGDRYLVKVVVAGCRTARFWVDTIRQDPNDMATTTKGTQIPIDSNDVGAPFVRSVSRKVDNGEDRVDPNLLPYALDVKSDGSVAIDGWAAYLALVGTPGVSLAEDINDVSGRVDAIDAATDPNAAWTAQMPAAPAVGSRDWWLRKLVGLVSIIP